MLLHYLIHISISWGWTWQFMIRDSRWGFEFSLLNSLLLQAFLQQDKTIKIVVIINEPVKFGIYLNTLNTKLCWLCSFFILILSILSTTEPTNYKKLYSRISEKHDQTSINLTVFDFIG